MAMNKTDWFEVLNDYLYNAHNTAQVLWHWASRTGGREAYEDMFALAERLDDAEVPPGDEKWLEVLSKGQGLTAIGDRELPEIRRVAWSLCPKWSSQERHDIIRKETRRMERHLLRSKNNMERAAKILSEAGRQQNAELSLKVNGVEIKRGAPGQVIRIEKTAKSQGERPEVEMELTGPVKELVTVRFSHHYDKALKHKLEGHELCYLKSMDADCLLAENGYGEWDIDIPEEGKPVELIFSTSGFSAVHAFNVLVNGQDIMSFDVEIAYTTYEQYLRELKYRESLREANEGLEPEARIEEGEGYSGKALEKVEELDELFRKAAAEFEVDVRVVKAAFASEYERREDNEGWSGVIDNIQDFAISCTPRVEHWGLINDLGLANIDYNTASRLKRKYSIKIPEKKDLDNYLVTVEGTARFVAAAIREAKDQLSGFKRHLPPAQKEIMNKLSKNEEDALLVAIYKEGPEQVREKLGKQLSGMATKHSQQKHIHVLEGYKAWQYWLDMGDNIE